MVRALFFGVLFCMAFVVTAQSFAQTNQRPLPLQALQSIKTENNPSDGILDAQPVDVRRSALENAALSYGARGGLAMRTFLIRQELSKTEDAMDRTFNFRQLLLAGPSGLTLEPPVISEAEDALIIENNGQQAAVSDVVFNINEKARFVTAPRNWRTYLEREWGGVTPPPDVLLPQNREERGVWRLKVFEGWTQGFQQADDIFQADLARLTRDFEGMVRYRTLLTQNIVSAPFALHEDRGITGGGDELRIGDRAVQITGPSQLQARPESWQPASR